MSQDLKSFVLNNRKFIKLKDGESFRGVYRGCQIARSRFDPDKETVNYKFHQDGMDDGKVATWENGSTMVAELMGAISVGEEVVISRTGSTAKDTKYTVLPVNESSAQKKK